MRAFVEAMFFAPKWYHYPFIVVLWPFSFLYGSVMWLRRKFAKRESFNIPIISIGNLVVGGSGKTPFVIALASRYDNAFIISRGYGRKSHGLLEIKTQGRSVTSVQQSGDEAMLMAHSLPNASVIVSEDRKQAIEVAKQKGAKVIFLDDGFNRVDIEKYEILLEPVVSLNYYPFPAGPYREFLITRRKADLLVKEDKEFARIVSIEGATEKMVLVTAISDPSRLDKYLPEGVVKKVYYEDHAYFDEEKLKSILDESGATSILCTSKDRVKMKGFKFPISEMKLKLEIKYDIYVAVDTYIDNFYNQKS